jgi:hypothetical protein
VLGADGSKHAVAERRLRGEQPAQDRIWNFGPLRLFSEKIPEEGVASDVATQNGVKGNSIACIQTSLCEQDRWNGGRMVLIYFEHGKPMIDRGDESGIKALKVNRIGDIARIGDRVDARRDRRPNLGQTFAEARCKRGA